MSDRKPIWILKTGEALPPVKAACGDFELWIARGIGCELEDVRVASVHDGDPLPQAESAGGVVVTGSPAMVTERLDWSEASARWLDHIIEEDIVPVLGLCYGHQLLAHARGGEVGPNPRGREMGTVEVALEAVPEETGALLQEVPLRFRAHMSHLESVLALPSDARVLASTAQEPHAAIQFGPRQWGVQFHPEFDREIMQRYIEARREVLVAEGLAPDALIGSAAETPESTSLLGRFGALVAED